MERENLIPILGLLALAAAGAAMLFATSGEDPEPRVEPVVKNRTKAKAKAPPQPIRLVHKGEVGDRPAAPAEAKNLVVITGVAVRRDTLGAYGGPEGLTPRLDELAAAGAAFDDYLTAGVFTREAIPAMFTGKHAIDLGMVEPDVKPSKARLDAVHLTIAEALAERGWWTVGVNASPAITRPDSSVWQGFDHVRDSHPQGFKPQNRLGNVAAAQQAVRMLAERPTDRPFYLQVVLTESHKPVKVPPAESKPWADAGLPNPAYMATIRRMDDAVGVVEAWLVTEGLADSTYVVFVADTGEGLGRPKHHGPAHGRYLARTGVQLPWIVRGPGIPEGSRVGGLASGVDVGPTLLGLLGVDGALGEVSGEDWSDVLARKNGRTSRERAISDTWYLNANRASIWTERWQCQKDFGSKNLDKDPFQTGCYDRQADPDFETPIERPELMAELEAWRAEHAAAVEAP